MQDTVMDHCCIFFVSFVQIAAEVDCRKFISSLCFSYLIASTSALNEQVRHAGYHCLGRFDSHLRKTSLRGKRQVCDFTINSLDKLERHVYRNLLYFISKKIHFLNFQLAKFSFLQDHCVETTTV